MTAPEIDEDDVECVAREWAKAQALSYVYCPQALYCSFARALLRALMERGWRKG